MQILALKKRPIDAKSGESDPFKTIFSLKLICLLIYLEYALDKFSSEKEITFKHS